MRALHPGQRVHERVAIQIATLRRIRGVAHRDVRAVDVELREPQPDAVAARRFVRKEIAVSPVREVDAEVVQERRPQNRREAEQHLLRPVHIAQPVRGQRRAPARPEPAVLVVGEAQKPGVVVAGPQVHARAEQMSAVRGREHASECAGRGQIRLKRVDAVLARVLVVHEVEGPIAANRAADPCAGITPGEVRIRIERIAPQRRARGEVIVPEEEIRRPADVVAAAARHDVHGADAGDAGRQIEVGRRELELLDDFLREVHRGVAFDGVADVAAVHRDRRLVGIAAENRNREQRVVLRGRARVGRHARLEERELQETAPIERQFLDFLPGDDAGHRVGLGFDVDGGGGDQHGLTRLAQLHPQVKRHHAPGRDGDLDPLSAEAGQLGDDDVPAGAERGRRVGPVLARCHVAFDTGRQVPDGDGGAGNHCVGLIADSARDGPDRGLRPCRRCGQDDGQAHTEGAGEYRSFHKAAAASGAHRVSHIVLLQELNATSRATGDRSPGLSRVDAIIDPRSTTMSRRIAGRGRWRRYFDFAVGCRGWLSVGGPSFAGSSCNWRARRRTDRPRGADSSSP
jgi:hypothetical protein